MSEELENLVVKPAYLKRAWRHIISTAIIGNKKRALTIVFIGIITTIIQMLGMLTLVMAARAYENNGLLSIGPIELDLSASSENSTLIMAAGGALLILLASVFAGLYQQIIITRIGRKFFEETLDDTRRRLRLLAKDGKPYEAPQFMRMLQRDSRYLSLSYMRTLGLLQPGLLVIVFLAYALSRMPIAAGFLIAGCLLMIPAHIYMSRWSAKTSEDIQAAAKLKSAEELAFIAEVGLDPFSGDWDERYQTANRPVGEHGFISAFVSRQRIGAYSQFITDSAMALVVIAVVVFMARKGGGAIISLSSIMVLLILFRLVMGFVSKFAQAVTMVSSYEPFFRELLGLYEENDEQFLSAHSGDELLQPCRLVALQNKPLSRGDGQFYKNALGVEEQVYYVNAKYDVTGRREVLALPQSADVGKILGYDSRLAKEINTYLNNDESPLSDRAKYMLSYICALHAKAGLVLCCGEMWSKLSKDDLRFLVSAVKTKHFVLVYHRPPGKLVLPLRFQVAVRTKRLVNIICSVPSYKEHRAKIIKILAKERAGQAQRNTAISADEVETY